MENSAASPASSSGSVASLTSAPAARMCAATLLRASSISSSMGSNGLPLRIAIRIPRTPSSGMFGPGTGGRPMVVGSAGSGPASTDSISAASATVRVRVPTWSSDQLSVSAPARLIRAYVGLRPTRPQWEAGILIDPPVSEPMPPATMPAATDAPVPPLDPPALRSRSHGFRVGGV